MQSQIQNLKDSELTQVLADGFAMLYHNRPQFPVTYLAHYMKNHIKCKEEIKNMNDKISYNAQLTKEMQAEQKQAKLIEQKQKAKINEVESEQKKFLEKIQKAEYHEDVLDYFCDWIERKYNMTGVYLGELIVPKKPINLEEQDSQQAHIDPEAPKLIKFRNSSVSHRNIVLNKTLSLESIVGKLVSGVGAGGQAQGEAAQGAEEGEKEGKPKDELYINSVVGNQDLHFFKYPKLGAFFAVSFKIKSYLLESVLDANITKTQTFQKALEEYEKEQEERQTKFRQGYDEKAAEGAEEQQLEQMQKQFQEECAQFPKPKIQDFQCVERSFVLALDTLGQDRGITQENRIKIKELVAFLKQKWEKSELQSLKIDIDRHLKLEQKIEGSHQEAFLKLIEEQDRQLPASQEVEKVKDNQKLVELQMDTLRIQKIKEYLSDQKYEPFLEQITNSKVLKNKEILKYWIIFCGVPKQEVNIEGTNLLDLRKARKYLLKDSMNEKISSYNPRGSKNTIQVKSYAKWERMLKNIQGIQAQNIAVSNIYVAFLLRFLQLIAKVRIADRERRIEVMKQERKLRKERIKQNEKKLKDKEVKMNAAKAEAEEKEEQFNAEAWEATYNEAEQNALAQVGPEIGDQIDKDLENGEQIFPEEEDPPAEEEPAEEKAE